MTQDEIIDMARRAGFRVSDQFAAAGTDEDMVSFAKLVAAKEREALLDVVYSYANSLSWNEDFQADIDAIRARGKA